MKAKCIDINNMNLHDFELGEIVELKEFKAEKYGYYYIEKNGRQIKINPFNTNFRKCFELMD